MNAARAPQAGLTLLELLVVLALMAFVAATVTVQLGGQLGRAAMGQAISQWEFTDAQMRSRARRKGHPVSMHVEIGSNQMACAWNPEDDRQRTGRSLGRGVELVRFVSATQDVTYGPVRIDYAGHGATESFAIELKTKHERRWLFVAGITGQTTEMADEKDIRRLLEQLVPKSVHAG